MSLGCFAFLWSLVLGCNADTEADRLHYSYTFEMLFVTIVILALSNCFLISRSWSMPCEPCVSKVPGLTRTTTDASVQCNLLRGERRQDREMASAWAPVSHQVFFGPSSTKYHLSAECGHLKHTARVQSLALCLHCSGVESR